MRTEFLRFLVGGGINTAATYLLFLALAAKLNQTVAYTITYVAGIVFSYLINALFVFNKRADIRTAAIYPIVYLIQYFLGLAVLSITTMYFSIAKETAMLIAIVVNIPATFLMLRLLLGARRQQPVSGHD